ncbi:MAG TPA: hypothetical protein VJH34_00680 [archaeon]|nr:hypothetical protein [archaeon]
MKFMPWLGMIYECIDCGYRGPLAVSKIEKVKKIGIKKSKKGP